MITIRKNILIIIIIILVLSIFIYTNYENVIVYVDQKHSGKNEEQSNDLLYYKEYFSNNDIIGTIKIKGTSINTLLVKTTNNEYYLNHAINKEYDIRGAIFLDYRTNLNSKQINIYGHNSKEYNLLFKELEKYKEKEFYDNHNLIEIWDGIKTTSYKIFSIQIVTDKEHMNIDNINQKHINKLNESIYETEEKATINDNILIIQTCNYNPKNSYLLINAKQV